MYERRFTFLFTLVALGAVLGGVLAAQPGPVTRDVRERAWQANNLGVAYLEQFSYEKAAAQFEAALAIDGTFTPARVNLAIARLYEPDLPAAARMASAAAASPDAPPHADFVLGLIARNDNREEDALTAFRRVLEVDPDDVASLVNLGQLLLQRRAYSEAVPVFARAVELEPYNVSALYNLAVAQTRAGQREQGAASTAKFQVLRETGYGTTYANTYMEQGRYAEAILSTGAESDVAPAAPDADLPLGCPRLGHHDPDHRDRCRRYRPRRAQRFRRRRWRRLGGAHQHRCGAATPAQPPVAAAAGLGARGAMVADVRQRRQTGRPPARSRRHRAVAAEGRLGRVAGRLRGRHPTDRHYRPPSTCGRPRSSISTTTATPTSCSAAPSVTAARPRRSRPGATTATVPLPTSRPAPCPHRRHSWRAQSSPPTSTCGVTSTCSSSVRTAASASGATCATPRSVKSRPMSDWRRSRQRPPLPSVTSPRTASPTLP